MLETTVLIDFGSAFTKVTAVDCVSASVIGRAQSPTTIHEGVGVGLELALQTLLDKTGRPELRKARRLASSSAAGGLRMVVCGLVPRLTSEAARRAALGAGAKIIGSYSYRLTKSDIRKIDASAPDIMLLSGGTDGGEGSVVLANAEALAASKLRCPFVLAANRSVNDEAAEILRNAGREVHTAANVMPEFGRLEVDSARKAIREVFIQRVVHAMGLDEVQATFDAPVMPTPMAVLMGTELLARGHGSEAGFGDLLLFVVIGGRDYFLGPVVAALVFTALPELLRVTSRERLVIFSLILLVVVIARPQGLVTRPVFWRRKVQPPPAGTQAATKTEP